MSWLVNLSGVALMGFVVWWFWLAGQRHPAQQATGGDVHILVADGVYEPDTIHARAGQPLTLHFERRDPAPCAEQVIFADLNISQTLPVNKITSVQLTPEKPGRYPFTCQMQMYRGTLIIE